MPGSWTVATFPLDPLELACPKCSRSGRYARASLLERFGPAKAIPDVLVELADCTRHRSASDPCGVRLARIP